MVWSLHRETKAGLCAVPRTVLHQEQKTEGSPLTKMRRKAKGKMRRGESNSTSNCHFTDISILPLPDLAMQHFWGEADVVLPAVGTGWVSSTALKNCQTGEKALGLMTQCRNRLNLSESYVASLCSCGEGLLGFAGYPPSPQCFSVNFKSAVAGRAAACRPV